MASSTSRASRQPSEQWRALIAVGLLLIAVILWGLNFVVVKFAVTDWPVWAFIALRFWIATVIFFPFAIRESTRERAALISQSFRTLGLGVLAGSMLFLAYALQTWGIKLSAVSAAALLTSLSVVIVPLLLMFSGEARPGRRELIAATIAAAGVIVFQADRFGTNYSMTLGLSMLLLILGAMFFALHIIVVATYGRGDTPLRFTNIQFITVAGLSTIAIPFAADWDAPAMSFWTLCFIAVFTGVLATGVPYVCQTYAQRSLSPTVTAVFLTLEPPVAGLAAYLLLDELISPLALAGGGLIIVALLVSRVYAPRTTG